MISVFAHSALIALFTLVLQAPRIHAQSSATSPLASTATGVMKLEGCFSSSGDLSNVGSWEWQSSSYCEGKCTALNKPVLALQAGNCWCGDSMPALDTQVSSSECTIGCYGYDKEDCGGDGTWTVWLTGQAAEVGYISGGSSGGESSVSSSTSTTTGAAAGSSTTTAVASGTDSTSSSFVTSESLSVQTSSLSPSTSASSPSTSSVAQITSVAVVTSAEPTTVVATVTVGGAVKTIIGTTIVAVTATSTPNSSTALNQSSSSSGPNKIGIAVGIVVGILVLAALIGAAFFYFRRKNRKTGSNRHSRQSSMDVFRSHPNQAPFSIPAIRVSTLNDSRLDPRIMVDRRQSGGSMFADNVDYSRRILKVTNPDG